MEIWGAFKIGGRQKEMVESGSQQASTFQPFSSLLSEMHYLNSTILPFFATQNLSHPRFVLKFEIVAQVVNSLYAPLTKPPNSV